MLVYGFHSVLARLRRRAESVTELYVDASRDDARMRELLQVAQDAGVRPLQVDAARLQRLCAGRRHQGVVAFAKAALPERTLEQVLGDIDGPALLLVLDGVTDPRNLGACLRVAEGAGAHAVVAPKDHACMLTEVAAQTSSGACESIPYLMVTNLGRAFDQMQEHGVWIVGAADDAERTLYDAPPPASVAWVLGAEGRGMRRLTRDRCDQVVHIPMRGIVDSLNVAVAAGILLYESVRATIAQPVAVR